MIKCSCTWGDGPDVLLVVDNSPFMCYEEPTGHYKAAHGFVHNGSAEMTADEALELSRQLFNAATIAKNLERDAPRDPNE